MRTAVCVKSAERWFPIAPNFSVDLRHRVARRRDRRHRRRFSMWHLLSSIALPQPLSVTRHTIPFPRGVLRKFIADTERAVPGTRIDSPGFIVNGCEWQVALYPFGGNADPSYAGRVGVYLRMLQQDGSRMEVDASFTMTLNVIPAARVAVADDTDVDAEAREAARRGAALLGGMTFCPAEEAGESVGRCEDWACRPAHRTLT